MKKKPAKSGAQDALISLRLPSELVARAEALLPALRSDPDLAEWRGTRLGVLRLAIIHGLDDLEETYGEATRRGR